MLRIIVVFGLIAITAGVATWRPDLAEMAYREAQKGYGAVMHMVKRDHGPAAQADGRARGPAGAPAVAVTLARADKRTMPILVNAVGTVQPIASLQLKSRLDSQVVTVHVQEGALVAQGDLLFTLDDRTLVAQIAQVDAQIARDRAQIEQGTRERDRAIDLARRQVGTEVARDNAITNLKAQEAQLAADLANRANLAAQLSYTRITAPVAGRIGSIAAKAGAFVRSADPLPLATLNQINPIYIAFAVPQATFYEMRGLIGRNEIMVEATVGGRTSRGAIAFIENTVDATTGTVTVKARMENGAEQLWPGSFVPVQVTLGVENDAIVVPAAAVQVGQNGSYLFVAREGRARVTQITVARMVGDQAVLSRGLSGGEDVIISGQLRLVEGIQVVSRPATAASEPPRAAPRS